MPQLIPIITAIVGAAGVGTSIYSLTNQPSAPKATTPSPAQVTADAAKTKQNQIAAISQAFPTIQAQTGGALSPDTWLQLGKLISGQSGQPGVGAADNDILALLGANSQNPFSVTAGGTGGGGSSSPGLTPTGSSFG